MGLSIGGIPKNSLLRVPIRVCSAQNTNTSSSNNTATTIAATSSMTVHAGGGNSAVPLTVFVPQQIRVSTGQSITWDNPSTVAEPHTVTFVLDNKTATNIVSPFAVHNLCHDLQTLIMNRLKCLVKTM